VGIAVAMALFFIVAVLEAWLTYVVFCCYRYIRDKSLVGDSLPKYTKITVEQKEVYNPTVYPTFVSAK
jgi:hypothetical protein